MTRQMWHRIWSAVRKAFARSEPPVRPTIIVGPYCRYEENRLPRAIERRLRPPLRSLVDAE